MLPTRLTARIAPSAAAHARVLISARRNTSTKSDPLRPSIPTDELGLPLEPQPVTLTPTSSTSNTIKSSDLARLHRLSALNPPLPGSREEADLLKGLNELVGLMEVVKAVELPEGKQAIGELLTQGVGEVMIGENTGKDRDEGQIKGRELLEWATSRKGDYYHTKKA